MFQYKFRLKTEEEKFISRELKKLEDRVNWSRHIDEYAGILTLCKLKYEQTIEFEKNQVIRGRKPPVKPRISEHLKMIKKAAIGWIVVDEAQYELGSISNMKDIKEVMDNMKYVLHQMLHINKQLYLDGKEVNKLFENVKFDDIGDSLEISERVELIDNEFVEKLVDGKSMDDCLALIEQGKQEIKQEVRSFDDEETESGENTKRKNARKKIDEKK